jgi:3-phenylpropionate/trans-cinnamate dioxygenase ferredoxin subunit
MFNYTQIETAQVEFVRIVPLVELAEGERLFVELDNQPIVVFNLAGQVFAIGDVCTHDNGPLGDGEVEEYEVVCPRHGGRFDVRTGKATSLPAVIDIPAYPVRLVDGNIEVGIPKT